MEIKIERYRNIDISIFLTNQVDSSYLQVFFLIPNLGIPEKPLDD